MTAYIIRRLLYALPIALGVSIVCFALVYIAPGDPLQTLLPESRFLPGSIYSISNWFLPVHDSTSSMHRFQISTRNSSYPA